APVGDSQRENSTTDVMAPTWTSEIDPSRARPLDPGAAVIDASRLDNLTGAGGVLGTVGYMAPEQVRGEAADARADVFAVGAVLYEVLTGKPAFPGRTRAQRTAAILHRDPDPLVGDAFPDGLDNVVRRALARDREERYLSAAAFLV